MFALIAPLSVFVDQVALIVEALRRTAAAADARQRWWNYRRPPIQQVWNRLGRTVTLLTKLLAQMKAGTLPPPRDPVPRTAPPRARTRAPSQPRTPPEPGTTLPRVFGWVSRYGWETRCYVSQLQHLLAQPEVADLLRQLPQTAKILRPLCWALGIKPDPAVLPPPPRRVRTTPPTPPASSAEPEQPEPRIQAVFLSTA